ncbi:HIT family protein [Patescibacteria group bacterium]|nr:HIT family protein [Patescibacteria group bacterium]MBU1612829.1 HIT family protein [Patescibacteria group bacterium]
MRYFVAELETGYVVVGDFQFFRGYTLFLCKQHKTELHQLDKYFRIKFLEEMSEVAEAVNIAFQPKKLNYKLLGNTDEHLHWHIFPRYENDPRPQGVTWCIDKSIRYAEEARPNDEDLAVLKEKLLNALKTTASNIR